MKTMTCRGHVIVFIPFHIHTFHSTLADKVHMSDVHGFCKFDRVSILFVEYYGYFKIRFRYFNPSTRMHTYICLIQYTNLRKRLISQKLQL